MKEQNHKSTKLWTLLLLVFLIFIGCEQETEINEQTLETTAQRKNSIEKLTLDKLSSDSNFNYAIKNFGLKNILENDNSTILKKSSTEISVDTENIIEIKKKNYTSYTFRVTDKNKDNKTFKNLVVEQRNDTLQGFLIKYKYSQHYLEQLEKGIEIPFEGTVQRTPFFDNIEALFNTVNQSKSSNTAFTKSSSYICATSTLVGEKRCGSSSKHRVGEYCKLTGSNRAYYYTYTVTNCWYDNNTGLGGEEEVIDHIAVDDIPGGGGTTTTPNTPPCDNCDGNYLAKEISTRLGLFAEEEQWLENLGEDQFVEDLYLFLDGDNSLEATLFGKETIEAKREGEEVNFEEFNTTKFINNLKNPITDKGIELYLLAKYKNSGVLDLSLYSIAQNEIEVGDYFLKPHYGIGDKLVFYSAYRDSQIGIEYIIKADDLASFQDNISIYTAAANLFYLNGIPSNGQVAMAAGDYFTGLKDMWADALTDPNYYVYLAHIFVGTATNLNAVNSASTTFNGKIKFKSVTDSGATYPNIEITNRTYSQYKSLINQKYGLNWNTISNTANGPIQIIEIGSTKYVARPLASNQNYNLTIEYWRNGVKIGVFRFNN